MKKILLLTTSLVILIGSITANVITPEAAQKTAISFYKKNVAKQITATSLAYTEKNNSGSPLYYVFNINNNDGFVIVSADNGTRPIVGYSDRGHYDATNLAPNFVGWMKHYAKEIDYTQKHPIQQTAKIADEWGYYAGASHKPHNFHSFHPVPPLSNVVWSQWGAFNAMCPGGSVTGCCATSMAQVMHYWKYPQHGLLSHAYNENTPQYSNNYGVLHRNFYADTFKWSTMADTINSPNPAAALLMYDCGISIDMNYAPGGSNAQVICPTYYSNSGADSVSCQSAYTKFFGYNRHTIRGLYKGQFTDTAWVLMIENELTNGRMVQYTGGGDIGHAWVCEGFDSNSYFFMNWGWGGSPNGYFSLTNLNPYGYNFDSLQQGLIGIEPPAASAQFYANNPSVNTGSAIYFNDESVTPTHITSWNWSFPGGTPSTSTSQNPLITYATPGIYSATLIVTAPGGADTITRTNYIIVQPANNPLPLSQGFEGPTFPPPGWYLNNPNNWTTSIYSYGNVWQPYYSHGGYGLSNSCMMFNNFNKNNMLYLINQPPPPNPMGGQYQQIYTPAYSFKNVSKDSLSFDLAYAPFNSTYSDTLAIYYSLDGGVTWENIYLKGGMTLATTDSISSNANDTLGLIPTPGDWRTEYIPIPPALYGQSSVMFSFENRSYWGGQLYVDNVHVPAPPSVLSTDNLSLPNEEVNLYPNPNNGSFTLEVRNGNNKQKVEVYNELGKQIYTSAILPNTGVSFLPINLPGQSAGVYLYRIIDLDGNQVSEGKFLVQ